MTTVVFVASRSRNLFRILHSQNSKDHCPRADHCRLSQPGSGPKRGPYFSVRRYVEPDFVGQLDRTHRHPKIYRGLIDGLFFDARIEHH
jgi:hypothetical protein